jgi:hypothetical protein
VPAISIYGLRSASIIGTAWTPVGPSGARLGHPSLSQTDLCATRAQSRGKALVPVVVCYFGGCRKLVVELRLTEILIEVGGIAAAGAGEVCLFRVGIRAAAAFASGWLVLDAQASLCLPAAVAGIGVRLGFRSRLCSLPGLRTPLAVIVLRTGPGRGLARLAVLIP